MSACVSGHSPSVCHAGRQGSFPFALDKHFLSVNTGEPGTPQLPDEHTRTHTLEHKHNLCPSCWLTFSHSCSSLHADNCRHKSHMLLPYTYTHCNTNTPPSTFSFPPPNPLSGRSLLSPSLLLKHLFFPFSFLSHFHTNTYTHTKDKRETDREPVPTEGGERVSLFGAWTRRIYRMSDWRQEWSVLDLMDFIVV